MSRTVTVGLDGSNESLAAAEWAAREAELCELPLRVVHAGEQQPHTYVPFAGEQVQQLAGQPVPALIAAAREAELLVLGSRGLGRAAGVLLGSVALAVAARAERPVVLVRAVEEPVRTPPYGDVVLGLDPSAPDDQVLAFAFAAASRRAGALRVVHGWSTRQSLADVLRPWQDKFPGVEVTEEAVIGNPGAHLVDVSRDASLVVVGRRNRGGALGPHIGPVAHAVLQHAVAPVAVVPHD